MHKRKTRGQQLAIRSFTYGVMTLFAVLGVVLCLSWAMGFRFDWNDGKLTQVALLQFNSFPTGATVDINGQVLSSRTSTRSNVKTGETTVIMSKDGYRSWRKTVNMLPSSVVWLNYARLIPDSISTDTAKSFEAISEIRESPDKRWILIKHTNNDRCGDSLVPGQICPEKLSKEYLARPFTLTLVDISDPQNVRFSELAIPSQSVTLPTTGQNEYFSIVEWDQGSRFILIKHVVGETTEYLELDRSNADVVRNLTRDFGMPISDPHFSGTSGNVFFALTGASLRKFDYGSETVSVSLANGVQSYQQFENNRLALVTTETNGDKTTQSVAIYNDGRVTTVEIYPDNKPTKAVLVRFNNTDYLAIARGKTVTVIAKPLELDDKSELVKLNNLVGIDWLDYSPSGEFILAGGGDKLISLDLDTVMSYAFEVKGLSSAPEWIDNDHIIGTSGGRITFIEFDGQNREDIVSARGRATLSRDGKYLFSFDNIAGGAVLQRSKLVVD